MVMMRDWLLQWVRSGDRDHHRSTAGKKGPRRRRDDVVGDHEDATSAGCMCAAAAVFHLFDMHHHHHLQFPLNQRSSSSVFLDQLEEDEITPSYAKGVEAPRNSLEMDTDSNSVAVKEEQDRQFRIPVGIQIKTKVSSSSKAARTDHDLSSQCSSSMIDSPGTTKTPSLVARLMGLDLLPEECSSTSPSLSSCSNSNSKLFSKKIARDSRKSSFFQTRSKGFYEDDISVGARSLPETPRLSSARRSDVEYYHQHRHHRLSLNEERKGRFSKIQSQDDEENRISISSPRSYAKQIVKNVKESVMSRRRVGLTDISNVTTDRESRRRDQNLILIEPTKKNKVVRIHDHEENCSNNKLSTSSGTKSSRLSSSSDSNDIHLVKGIHVVEPFKDKKEIVTASKISTTVEGSSNNSSDVIRKFLTPGACEHGAMKRKKQEQFVRSNAANRANLADKKCKKTALSSDILSIKQVKKDPSPSPTKLPQKQVSSADAFASKRSTRLSSKPSHSSYKHSNNNKISLCFRAKNVPPRDHDRNSVRSSTAHEYGEYIQLVLKRARITKRSSKWHSLKQPVDPFIFYHLELFHYGGGGGGGLLSRRCNRKLIFQLLNELLADIMIHHNIRHLGLRPANDDKGTLSDELCRKIGSFPAAKCEVLEDIDGLIGTDMCTWESNKYSDEELQGIMCEIEGDVVELLVKQTVVVILEEQRRLCPRVKDMTWQGFFT